MANNPRDFDPVADSSPLQTPGDFERRRKLGSFFRARRLAIPFSEAEVAEALDLSTHQTVMAYESGRLAMPLEDVYALTNLLNLAPEDVMDLIHGLYPLGTD